MSSSSSAGVRAYSLKALTICFIDSTCCTIVCVARSSSSASRSLRPDSRRRRIRSADSWIGVSGFLISCASRRATSPQAASRCACSSWVMSSKTSTSPAGAESSVGSAVQAHMSSRRPLSRRRVTCSRHSVCPAATCVSSAARNCASSGCSAARSASLRPAAASRSTPRMLPAAWLATRMVRSGPSEITPVDSRARMMARLARSLSTAWRLPSASARARASRLVMSLNEVTR